MCRCPTRYVQPSLRGGQDVEHEDERDDGKQAGRRLGEAEWFVRVIAVRVDSEAAEVVEIGAAAAPAVEDAANEEVCRTLGEDVLNERRERGRRARRSAARDRGLERPSSGRVGASAACGRCPWTISVGLFERTVYWSIGDRAGSDDPPIAGFNELNRVLAVPEVGVDGCRQRRRGEVSERREELDRRAVLNEVLQVEEVHVTGEV